jgi:hypothetical protein
MTSVEPVVLSDNEIDRILRRHRGTLAVRIQYFLFGCEAVWRSANRAISAVAGRGARTVSIWNGVRAAFAIRLHMISSDAEERSSYVHALQLAGERGHNTNNTEWPLLEVLADALFTLECSRLLAGLRTEDRKSRLACCASLTENVQAVLDLRKSGQLTLKKTILTLRILRVRKHPIGPSETDEGTWTRDVGHLPC